MESPPAFREESVMRYTKLGSTGLEVSSIALGAMTYGEPGRGYPAWSLTEEDSRPLIEHAVEAGINFFDTANWYSLGSSEEILGRALKDYADRDNVVVCTKIRQALAAAPPAWLDPIHHHARPLQSGAPRGGTRDAAAVCRRGRGHDGGEPAGARPAGSPMAGRGDQPFRVRPRSRLAIHRPDSRFRPRHHRRRRRYRRISRCFPRHNRPGVAAPSLGGDGPDRRGQHDRADRR